MSAEIIKYGFTAGEIAPKLYGRTDLEKYDLGVAMARNFFVDYKGGLLSRPGTKFCDYVMNDNLETKFVKFQFAPNVGTTYAILFGSGYIRFIQSGQYILEPGKAVTTGITQANPGVVTAAAHGYSNGDWVKPFGLTGMTSLNAGTFQVAGVTTNTFQLLDHTGANVNTSALPAQGANGTFYRIYTIASPYATTDLATLHAHQSKSIIRLTHNSYAPQTLTRISDTNWTLTGAVAGPTLSAPTSCTVTPSASGSAGVAYCVTALDINNVESLPSPYGFTTASVNFTTTAGSEKVTWPAVTGAVAYNIYRSIVAPVGTDVSRAMEMGFVGVAYGTQFVDNNIIPDFTNTPPNYENPFTNGQVDFVTVTAGGTGYTNASTISASGGGGTGFVGYPVVNTAGAIIGVVVLNPGSGYTSAPTITATVGTGATFTPDLTPSSGAYPAESAVFQQRQIYAATLNKPLDLFGSRSGQLDNFNFSQILRDDDALEFTLDSRESSAIRHLLPTRFGLAIFSQTGLWHLGSDSGLAVTPTSALADIQSYVGIANLPPIPIDVDIIYIEGKGTTVRMISYTAYTRVYTGQDLTILSSHLFSPSNQAAAWDYAADPHKIIYVIRQDGTLATLTLVKEQNIFGWTRSQTKGLYKDMCVINEGTTDTVYYVVQRYINGRWTKFIEQQQSRDFPTIEDAWCVDCALNLGATYPAATLTPAASSGSGIVFTASAAVFSAGNVGSIIRGNFGKAVITAYTNTTHVVCDFLEPMTLVVPEDTTNMPLPMPANSWTMDAPFSTVSGLGHLEGQTVSILADGSVHAPQVVTNGVVTLDVPCSRVVVGLPYTCLFQSLPPVVPSVPIVGKRQRITGLGVRMHNSRGLTYGERLDKMLAFKERGLEPMGEPGTPLSTILNVPFPGTYNELAQFYVQQSNPLPAALIGLVLTEEIGDDSPANGRG